ncbi:MAG: T9SS type A sorting domain-containing protein [Bacteroidota bacterium]
MQSKITLLFIGLLSLGSFAQTPISSTIAYQGVGESAAFVGQGEYQVFLDNTTGILDKPIFLLDGFDPGNTRNIASIYNFLNYGTGQNLATDLRNQGYDVVILNFPTYTRPATTTVIDGGVDFIQRNAMILVALINQINGQKVGTQKNVVIGPSMGGLIARYALRYMEQNTLNHDTRLYVSFDAPHQGANVPIGMQHLFNYMAFNTTAPIAAAQPIVNGMLKSPAARQMLIDQFEGHLQTGNATEWNTGAATLLPTGCPNYRNAFQTELDNMGLPTTVRNIAIANGAGNGAMNYSPDFEAMNHTFNLTASQRAIINLRFTPAVNATNQVSRFRGQQNFGIWVTLVESLANSRAPSYTAGLDSAPGGRFDISALQAAAGADPMITEFFDNLLVDYFTFIPTASAMAVSTPSFNLYSPITGSTPSPFAASSIPTVNENHVTLNTQNTAFVLNEILNPVLATTENPALTSLWIQNPVQDNVQINTSYAIENATISITDLLGKTIFTANNQTINGTLEIPVSLSKGVYLITISDETGSITKKIVKG